MKKLKLRPYQEEASRRAVAYLQDMDRHSNGIIVLPTGSGKSLTIADIAYNMNSNILVLQPSKEILQQNYAKMRAYTKNCSMYSASVNKKEISRITFATIGSIFRKPEQFAHFKYIIVDECHLTDADDGMYRQMFAKLGVKVLGLTATPYRLYSQMYIVNNDTGNKRKNYGKLDKDKLKEGESFVGESTLKFITNIKGGNFKDVLYCVQVKDLVRQGFLAHTRYFEVMPPKYANMTMYKNSTGSDFSESSMRFVYDKCDMHGWTIGILTRLLYNSTIPRKGIIVFTKFVEEATALAQAFGDIAGYVHGGMNKKEREQMLDDFRSGKKKIMFNASCLVVGFDYPELDTLVMARPTLSLSVWYQVVGRILRPHPDKSESWVVDLCGNFSRFGKVEDLEVSCNMGWWYVHSNGKQLTDITM